MSDFGDILEKWSQRKDEKKSGPNMEKLMQMFPPEEGAREKVHRLAEEEQHKDFNRRAPKRIQHQAEIDLHGLTAESALNKLQLFLENARKQGLTKVLIIHGKGIHSAEKPVLGKIVRDFLENASYIGAIGTAKRAQGGSGALWAMIRQAGPHSQGFERS